MRFAHSLTSVMLAVAVVDGKGCPAMKSVTTAQTVEVTDGSGFTTPPHSYYASNLAFSTITTDKEETRPSPNSVLQVSSSSVTSGQSSSVTSGQSSSVTSEQASSVTSGQFSSVTSEQASSVTSEQSSSVTSGQFSSVTSEQSSVTSGPSSSTQTVASATSSTTQHSVQSTVRSLEIDGFSTSGLSSSLVISSSSQAQETSEVTTSKSPITTDILSTGSPDSTTLSTKIKTSIISSSTSPGSVSKPVSTQVAPTTKLTKTSTTKTQDKQTCTTSSSSSATNNQAPKVANIARSYPADIVDKLQDDSMDKLRNYLKKHPSSNGCTLENASVRREWSDLSVQEREDYIAAVLCLQSLPPKSSPSKVPGARSRFDDFVATHIMQTNYIHFTANFLSWHRYYAWTYEQALRQECNYKGTQPYWNWDRYASDPEHSPLFNGNASSLSGNSVNGGCVKTGPFKDMKVNLGPGASLAYNPRCLKRDISRQWASFTTVRYSYPLITQSNDIGTFQNTMQAYHNVHSGGHFTTGGDPGGDVYASPGDPIFSLHHSMIDRVWWIWQLQDLEIRLKAVTGVVVGQRGKTGSLTDKVDLGVNAPSVELGELLNTMDGKFCYIYV